MSSAGDSWGALDAQVNPRPGSSTNHASSDVQRRQQRRAEEQGAWDEDLEISIYGEEVWTLPGMGEQPASCGRWYVESFCDEAHLNFGVSRCQNRDCPSCWGSWSQTRSEKVARRLGAARYAAESGPDKRAVHFLASPEEGSVQSINDVYDMLKEGYDRAKGHGVRGGVAVPHLYRPTDETKRRFRDINPDGGIWKWIRENDRHWRDQSKWSPHVHIIGLARDVAEDNPEEQDGWVLRRLTNLKRFGLRDREGYDHMVGLTRYLLSHAPYEADESKQVVRWFGELAPASFSPEEELSAGALAVVERIAAEVAGSAEPTEEGTEGAEDDVCSHDGCECELNPIWEAGEALQNRNFCEEIGTEAETRLLTAFRWFLGEIKPPPGLRHPRTESDALEALEALL